MTYVAVGNLCQSRLNLEERLSIPGEVSLCGYPTPAGTKPTAGSGLPCQHLTNLNRGVWPKEKSMGRWKGVIQHPSKNHISTETLRLGEKKMQAAVCRLSCQTKSIDAEP